MQAIKQQPCKKTNYRKDSLIRTKNSAAINKPKADKNGTSGTRVVPLVTVFVGFEKEKHIITRPLSFNLNTFFVTIYVKRDSEATKQSYSNSIIGISRKSPLLMIPFITFVYFPVNDFLNLFHATGLF